MNYKPELIKSIAKYTIPLAFIFASCITMGVIIGIKINKTKSSNKKDNLLSTPIENSKQKFIETAQSIEKLYINDVDITKFTSSTLKDMIEKIDPFSSYIDSKSLIPKENESNLDHEGIIGVTTIMIKGVAQIIAPINGGPADEAGIKSGDIIVKIDDEDILNKNFNEKDISTKLSGPKDSKVILTVKRKGEDTVQQFSITRGKLPLNYVFGCMLNSDAGYIKLAYFAPNTSKEFFSTLNSLIKNGAKKLILDLRNNPGGDVEEALAIADKFLTRGQLICYTMHKSEAYNKKVYATSKNNYEDLKILIITDNGTAGPSEILTGALQDYDRALVVGERTFGKGIIQQIVPMQDGSQLILTVAKYCTPSGRTIQRNSTISADDTSSMKEQYGQIGYFRSDMIQVDEKLRYRTAMGRTVIGGGGIVPDFIIVSDTSFYPIFLDKINPFIKQIALDYSNQYSSYLNKLTFDKFIEIFEVPSIVINQLRTHAEKEDLQCNEATFRSILPNIRMEFKAYIANNIWGDQAYYKVNSIADDVLLKALHILNETNILTPATATDSQEE